MAEKEEINGTDNRREKKKSKTLQVEMEVLSESSDRMAPIVGYFPSGYDPVSTGTDPGVKVFRNKNKPNRIDLVVRPSDCNVEFVGKSYAGEAAAPQLTTYALGILDKEAHTLKIVPIAANKILRLEPRLLNGFEEPPEAVEEVIIDDKKDYQMVDLANIYGTKWGKKRANRWKSIYQKRNDISLLGPLEFETDSDSNNESSKDIINVFDRNIPPYDPTATTPESAYPLHKIIPKGERSHLLDILETLKSDVTLARDTKFWEENHYPRFVIRRLPKLMAMTDGVEKTQLACILSYITHLINFMKVAEHCRWKAEPNYNKATSKFMIPPIVFDRFLAIFLDPVSNILSPEKNELLICHILVLTLFADKFKSNPTDIEKDLAMLSASLKPYFLQLGCKPRVEGGFKRAFMTLPVPLVFADLKKIRRR